MRALIVALLVGASTTGAHAEEAGLDVNHVLGKRVEISLGDRPVLTYVHSPLQYGHPHFHPIHTPGGKRATRSAPADRC